ncbi:replication endonuclease [Pseudomonas fluorescens]|uniref:replication endonuclease n=1 Tax=Pseudomonas fluorescens TaxID=294 RepID=UPI0009BF0C71|nr:replication endonuclease [Pseudomonas fluorescens]
MQTLKPSSSHIRENLPTWRKLQVLGTLSNDAIAGVAHSYVHYLNNKISKIETECSCIRNDARKAAILLNNQHTSLKAIDFEAINKIADSLIAESADAAQEIANQEAAIQSLVTRELIDNPNFKKCEKLSVETQLNYLRDFSFIKRRLTAIAHKERLRLEARTKKIGADQKSSYCSDETLSFISRGDEKNAEFLKKKFVVIKETGEAICLRDIQKNKSKNKFNESYFIIKNLEAVAQDNGFTPYMLTLTAPANYHPNPAKGTCSFNKYSTTDSQDYLKNAWARLRAQLAKPSCGISMSLTTCFGVRTAELHRDGCVHWHIVLFIDPKLVDRFKATLYKSYSDTQAKLEAIVGSTASTYALKYIIKTVDSDELQISYTDKDIEKDALRKSEDLSTITEGARVRAGIRAMSIRQVQYYGVKSSLTVFRTLNKITESTDQFPPEIASIIRNCRINDRHTKTKNLSAYKNFLQIHIHDVELIRQESTNKHGLLSEKVVGIRFISSGIEYYTNNKYEICSALKVAKNERSIDFKHLETSSTAHAVTLISIYPREKPAIKLASISRPTASELLKRAREINPSRYYVNYINPYIENTSTQTLSMDEICMLMSTA